MRSFGKRDSNCRATFISRNLRKRLSRTPEARVREGSCSGKTLRASCIVIVEKPSESPRAFTFDQTAPKMRR